VVPLGWKQLKRALTDFAPPGSIWHHPRRMWS
jgi:hypothetical protein